MFHLAAAVCKCRAESLVSYDMIYLSYVCLQSQTVPGSDGVRCTHASQVLSIGPHQTFMYLGFTHLKKNLCIINAGDL